MAIEKTGIGLHSGARVCVRVLPADPSEGRYFVRTDLPGSPIVPADIASVSDTQLSTQLSANGASVRTVEHLLATLAAMGVSSARIEIDGPEVPLLDGSAREWAAIISDQWSVTSDQLSDVFLSWEGSTPLTPTADNPRSPLPPLSPSPPLPLCVHEGDAFVAAIPSPQLRFTYGIDFPAAAIGQQWHTWTPAAEPFDREIAPARTFCLAEQIESLRQAGLIKGGSLENALVCQGDRWLNPPLRFANEPARHKILDLVGDLSLLGNIPTAHFVAYKASHRLHARLARLLQERRTSRSH